MRKERKAERIAAIRLALETLSLPSGVEGREIQVKDVGTGVLFYRARNRDRISLPARGSDSEQGTGR